MALAATFIVQMGCSCQQSPDPELKTNARIEKSSGKIKDRMEASPVVWHDGRLLLIVSKRIASRGEAIEIWHEQAMLSSTPTNLGLGSAIVKDGHLHFFGVTDWGEHGNGLFHRWTTDLVNWSEPVLVKQAAPGSTIFNNSVTTDPNGFTLVYEVCEPDSVCFSARFVSSNNMVTWKDIGSVFLPSVYIGCPTIRFHNGFYYLFYLSKPYSKYVTLVARSDDLINWKHSSRAVLAPDDKLGEGENNSDMDLIEHEGRTKIIYAFGSQTTHWSDLRWADYKGPLGHFLEGFF